MIVFLCIMVLFAFNTEALPLEEFQEIPSAVEELARHKDVKINDKSSRGPSVHVLNLSEKENRSDKGRLGELLGSGKESTDAKSISLEEYVRQHRKEKNSVTGESTNFPLSHVHPKSHRDMKNITITAVHEGSSVKEEKNEKNKLSHTATAINKTKIKTADNEESSNRIKDKSKTSGNDDTSVHNKTKVSSMSKTTDHQESNDDKKHQGETHENVRPMHSKKEHAHEEKKPGGFMKFFTKKLQIANKTVEHEKLEHNRNEDIDETKKQAKEAHPHKPEKELKQKNDKLRKNDKDSEVKADKASHLNRAINKTKVNLVDVSHYVESQDYTAQLRPGVDSSDGNEFLQQNASKTLQHSQNSRLDQTERNEQHTKASADRKAPAKSNEIVFRILQKKLNESSGNKLKPQAALKTKTKKVFDKQSKQGTQTAVGGTFKELQRINRTKTKQKFPDKGKSVVILDRMHDINQNRTKDHEYTEQSDKEDDPYETRPEPGRERIHECEEHAHDEVSDEEDGERNTTIEKQFESTKGATECPEKYTGDSKNKEKAMVKILPAVKKPVGHQEISGDSDMKNGLTSPHAMKPTGSESNTKGSNKHRTHVSGTVRPHHLDKDTPANNEQKKNGYKNESVSTPSFIEKNAIAHGNRSEIQNRTGSSKSETTTEPIKPEEEDDVYIDASQIIAENNLQDTDIPLDEQNDITDNHRFENNEHEQKDTESSTSEIPQLHTSGSAEEWASTSAQDDHIATNQTSEVMLSATKSEQDCSSTEEGMFINTETWTEKVGNEINERGSVNGRKWKEYNTALHHEEESGRENNYGAQWANAQFSESTRPGAVSEGMELPVWGVQNFRSSSPMTMD